MEQYVYRDIEPKHLGMAHDGVLCLIDMGSSAPLIWETSGHIPGVPPQSYYSGKCELRICATYRRIVRNS